jgi:predicted phosphodiesterase
MYRKTGEKFVINPGSLGQPRDGHWPSYMVIDHPFNKISVREVPYDKSGLLKQLDELGESKPYLKRILKA